ncbi:MAG: hypothetical protein FRX48_02996 [Lasallia pustulata]|uniref:Uncharacterized protein n=1 Tax=Lasallia pustulata TaxID=136370 RepID=A0A5M8PUL3_9LECA|nr:MAG: hypothetical protein FRX48_02996 [Lasallia pustulata]
MFVLPPPPRYPVQNAYNSNATNGVLLPMVETINTVGHPTGPEYQLVVGEGTYTLRDELHLATPPAHPSEAPTTNANPLATTPAPPTAGVKLSLVTASTRKATHPLYKVTTSSTARSFLGTSSIRESEKEPRKSDETGSDGLPAQASLASAYGKSPVFGEGNILLSPAVGKEGTKRRKPKTNMVKSNSSFISRVIPHDALNKRLQEHSSEGLFAFANINRAFQWLDLSSATTKTEPLIKILFTKSHILCHDINLVTKSAGHVDVIMGSSTGDILWYEPMSQKYGRMNKHGAINPSPISAIRWLPGSENLFLASHMDGTLIVYDKEKDDTAFLPEENSASTEEKNGNVEDPASLHIYKSVNSRNQKFNPVASWKISNQKINGFAFSPDGRHLAVVSEDGSLRIIDYLREKLTDVYTSYYGGFMCVCWSPDGKYVLTGGQDDLVSIWSLTERQIVARCPGHHSWVTAVAFDPWRCDDRNYRFGSVGDDCRLLLWDFNVGMLRRPKATVSVRQRGSISSHLAGPRQRTESQTASRYRSNSNLSSHNVDGEDLIEHPVESRMQTAEVPPVMSKAVDPDPLSWIGFEEDSIVTSCAEGHIRTWDRPKEGVNGSQITLSPSGSNHT